MALDPRIKAVGFDMDGTFMHTHVDYAKLARVVDDELASLGVPPECIDFNDGSKLEMESGIRWLIEHGRGHLAAGIRQRVGDRATAVEMEHADEAEPFPGSVETLRELQARGYPVGILTRGGRHYAETVLGGAGVLREFDALVARDDFPEDEAKPSPKALQHLGERLGVRPQDILYLGDSKVDWLTAQAVGAPFIGVLSGGYTAADWQTRTGQPVHTLPHVADLLPLIRNGRLDDFC